MNGRLIWRFACVVMVAAAASAVIAQQQQPPSTPQQPSEVTLTINGGGGQAPRLAVPILLALSKGPETAAAARTLAQVLYDDLAFEREFQLLPRDTYSSVPAATSFTDIPFDRWRELNADGLIIGAVQKAGDRFSVQVRLFQVSTRQQAF